MSASENMPTGGDVELVALMEKLVPEEPQAAWLIRHCISWSATYDHVLDGDDWKPDDLHQMVRHLLWDLPNNSFYVKNFRVLSTVLLNGVDAWKFANDCKEYRIKVADGLAELGCAIFVCVGGVDRLLQCGHLWREAVLKLLKQSDNRKA